MHREKCEKNAQNMQKMMQKCKEVRNANALQKWNHNSHHTTVTIFFPHFHIFLHRIRIALPSLLGIV
jgi:hypothetical protein